MASRLDSKGAHPSLNTAIHISFLKGRFRKSSVYGSAGDPFLTTRFVPFIESQWGVVVKVLDLGDQGSKPLSLTYLICGK